MLDRQRHDGGWGERYEGVLEGRERPLDPDEEQRADHEPDEAAPGGERSDHALLHMTYACSLLARGFSVQLTSGPEEAWPLGPGSHCLDLPRSSLFSIVNFSPVTGLDIEGARFPLDNHQLSFGSSRTLSNVAEGPVTVRMESGHAVLVARPYDILDA